MAPIDIIIVPIMLPEAKKKPLRAESLAVPIRSSPNSVFTDLNSTALSKQSYSRKDYGKEG